MTTERQQRNLELARRGIETYEAGEIDDILALLAEDVVCRTGEGLIATGAYRGREGFVRWAREWNDAWERFESRIESLEPVGESHVVAAMVQTGRGRESGIELTQRVGYLLAVDGDSRCSYFVIHASPEAAAAEAREREAASGASA